MAGCSIDGGPNHKGQVITPITVMTITLIIDRHVILSPRDKSTCSLIAIATITTIAAIIAIDTMLTIATIATIATIPYIITTVDTC